MNIPRLYKTKTVTIETDEGNVDLKIRGFRGNDYDFIVSLDKIGNEINKQISRLTKVGKDAGKKNEDGEPIKDYSEDDIDELKEIGNRVAELKGEAREINQQLGQRGVKRFYYSDKTTDELDELPDIELDDPDIIRVANAMRELSDLNRPSRKESDKGKSRTAKKPTPKKKKEQLKKS